MKQITEACARAAHEANRAYCLAIGDDPYPPWEEAPGWHVASMLTGVECALAGNTPQQAHESWMRQKLADGWKHGPVKDLVRKEHPCMVPYEELPPEQRAKDTLFVAVVRATASALGWSPPTQAARVDG